jgi:hypothetical protein
VNPGAAGTGRPAVANRPSNGTANLTRPGVSGNGITASASRPRPALPTGTSRPVAAVSSSRAVFAGSNNNTTIINSFNNGGWGGRGFGYNPGWWGAWQPGFCPFGWGPFGLCPFGFSPGFGWAPFGFGGGFGFAYTSGNWGVFGSSWGGLGFGYRSGPWAFGVGLGWPVFGYQTVYSPPTVIVESPPVIIEQPPAVVERVPEAVIPPAQPEPQLPAPKPAQPPALGPSPAPAGDMDFGARAEALLREGKHADAVKALRHAVLDDPRNGRLLATTGQALFATGSYDEAAGAIQQSLAATPEADWSATAKATAPFGQTADATTAFKKALEKGPNQPELRFLAGYQAYAAGQYAAAVTELDALLKIAPQDEVAKKLRAAAAAQVEKK